MNKKTLTSLGLFGATTTIAFAVMHIMSLFDVSKWVGVSVGIALFAIMLVLIIVFKKHTSVKLAALFVNAVADGLASSSLFVHLGKFPALAQSAELFAVLVGIFALYCLLTYIPFARKHYIISMIAYAVTVVAMAIVALVFAEKSTAAIFSLALLHMIIFIAFFVSLAVEAGDMSEHIKNITYCSFAGLIVVLIAVLIVLSDGGDFTPGDVGIFDGGRSKRRNPYNFTDYAAYGAAATAAVTAATAAHSRLASNAELARLGDNSNNDGDDDKTT